MSAQPIHSYEDLIARATAIADAGRKKTVAVAAAQDVAVIDAVVQAQADGVIEAVLVGDGDKINSLASKQNLSLEAVAVVDEPDVTKAAGKAAELASQGKADLIMKGFLPTSALLRTVLNRKFNLRGSDTLSHCAVLGIPGYKKLINFTDGGMVVKPDSEQKLAILENAVLVARALGLSPVKVAVSAATDKITEKMPHTINDHEFLIRRVMDRMEDVVIQGPLTFDLATSDKAAAYYESSGEVIGDADIFLVDSIEECNIIAKSLIQFANAIFAGVIVGAKVPVSLVSRTDTVKNKMASLAIACLLSEYYQQNNTWGEAS